MRAPGVYTDVYLARYLKIRNAEKQKGAIFHVITRAYYNSSLSPSTELLDEYKEGNMSWEEYTKRFLEEIRNNPQAIKNIERYRKEAREKPVYLVCYEKDDRVCHRSIVKKLIDQEIILSMPQKNTLDSYLQEESS